MKKKSNKHSQGPEDVPDDAFEGKKFAVTGVFEGTTRDEIEEFIRSKGGRVTGSVSGVTNYVVAGAKLEDGREVSTSGKYRKAKDLGVRVLNEEEFEMFVREVTGLEKFRFTSLIADVIDEVSDDGSKAATKPSTGNGKSATDNSDMWTAAYAPANMHDMVGNQGAVNSLFEWLKDWDDVM